MADDVTDKANVNIHRDPSDGLKCPRSPKRPSLEDVTSLDEAISNARPDASTLSLGDAQQGVRKLPTALQRMKESLLSSQLDRLKATLAIDEAYCGATTIKGTRCSRASPASEGAIVSTLRRLTDMTQSSEKLDTTLQSLVRVVHCHQHSRGPPSEARVGEWVDTFPKGPGFERSPVVLARKMRKALGTISIFCAGWKGSGERCKARIGGAKVRGCQRSIDELVKADDRPNRAVWELLLSVLEGNRYCGSHCLQPSMQNVRQWMTELWGIFQSAQPGPVAAGDGASAFVHPLHAELTLLRKASGLQDQIDKMLQNRHPSREASGANTLPWTIDTLIEFWPSGPDITPLEVVLDGGSPAYHDPFQPSLCEVLASPLDAKERQKGYVYAYEVVGSPGYVKIGYTSRSVDVRQAEWTNHCNRRATLLYPLGDNAMERVPNACRVEALCHAVLHEYRRRIYCAACQGQHIEYFEVTADKAIHVIRECTAWMKKQPYQSSLNSGIVQWRKWERSLVHEQSFWTMVSGIGSLDLKD